MRDAVPFEASGVFWRPSAPDSKVHGTVTLAEDGQATLHTFGIVDAPYNPASSQLLPAPHPPNANSGIGRIVGITKYRPITMDGCFYGPSNYNPMGGISDSTIHARRTYFGARYEDGAVPTFDSVTFWLAGLKERLMFSGFYFDSTSSTTTIRWAPVEPLTVTLSDKRTLTFELSSSSPSVGIFPESVTLGQQAHVTIKTPNPNPIDHFTQAILPLEFLLSLAMDQPTGITKIVAETPDFVHEVDDQVYRVPIDVYSELRRFPVDPPEVGYHRMLFTYRDMKDRFADRLRDWFDYCDTAEPAINLHFATTSGAYRYLEGQFLSSAQAIEALHRRTFEQTAPVPPSDFDEILEQVKQSVPKKHRDRILSRLRYANEPSFRRRLKDAFEQYRHHYGDKKQLGRLISEIVDARNYLTHYDSDPIGRAPDSKSLIRLQKRLEALIQMHMLQTLHFNQSEIDSIVEKRLAHKLNVSFL